MRHAVLDVLLVSLHRPAALWAGASLGGPTLPVTARIDRGGDDDLTVAGVHILPYDGDYDGGVVVVQQDPVLSACGAWVKLAISKELASH